MRIHFFYALMLVALSFSTCNNDKAASSKEPTASTATAPAAAPAEFEKPVDNSKGVRYTWVDQLNVRDQPTTKGKVVARVKGNEPLTLTGEASDKAETIVLRGVAYNEPWFRITTADKKDGWVFGGAIKEKGAMKGNGDITDEEFDFPAFGYFKLDNWLHLVTENSEAGDAEVRSRSYRSDDGQLLEIEETEVGEYGYSTKYRITDQPGNLLKERNFSFTTDPNTITEEVVDHTDIPAKRYTRSQEIDQHFMQLNSRPLMVLGKWRIESID